jgi:hypothetical protein
MSIMVGGNHGHISMKIETESWFTLRVAHSAWPVFVDLDGFEGYFDTTSIDTCYNVALTSICKWNQRNT